MVAYWTVIPGLDEDCFLQFFIAVGTDWNMILFTSGFEAYIVKFKGCGVSTTLTSAKKKGVILDSSLFDTRVNSHRHGRKVRRLFILKREM